LEPVNLGGLALIALTWLCAAVFTGLVAYVAFKAGEQAGRVAAVQTQEFMRMAAEQARFSQEDHMAMLRRRLASKGILPPSGYRPVTRNMQNEVKQYGRAGDEDEGPES